MLSVILIEEMQLKWRWSEIYKYTSLKYTNLILLLLLLLMHNFFDKKEFPTI